MESTKIRRAIINGFGIKNRCRKETFFSVHSYGFTDEEALNKILVKFTEEKKGHKQLRVTRAYIFDAELIENGVLREALMPYVHPNEYNLTLINPELLV